MAAAPRIRWEKVTVHAGAEEVMNALFDEVEVLGLTARRHDPTVVVPPADVAIDDHAGAFDADTDLFWAVHHEPVVESPFEWNRVLRWNSKCMDPTDNVHRNHSVVFSYRNPNVLITRSADTVWLDVRPGGKRPACAAEAAVAHRLFDELVRCACIAEPPGVADAVHALLSLLRPIAFNMSVR